MDHATRRIVVAGASGFVGQAFLRALGPTRTAIALSRKPRPSEPGIEYRACDLFSLIDAEKGVEGAEAAVYLVHSMMPSARLTQGSFRDFDLIAADNFGRACARAHVRQIVYLGGLMPEGGELSEHLSSRLEVEKALGAHGVPVTVLRAGLVLGAGGSSFEILRRLVERLPAMLLPEWTRTRMQPIALEDVVALLNFALLNPATYGETFDIGAEEVLTYAELIHRTAEALGHERPLFGIPFLTPRASRLWVELVTGAPAELVDPLVESLTHPMVCRDRRLQELARLRPLGVNEALRKSVEGEKAHRPVAFQRGRSREVSDVRSVQRLPLPPGMNAESLAHEYMRALEEGMFSLTHVDTEADGTVSFSVGSQLLLLQLKYSKERSTPDRQLFYITGGKLARNIGRGRLEFRSFPELGVALAAIHEFRPRLPWPVYTNSQALVHLWFMRRFARRLARMGVSRNSASEARE